MITNVLLDDAPLAPVMLLLIGGVCVGYLILHSRWITGALLALSVMAVLALTLVPTFDSRLGYDTCTVQFSLPALGRVELLANVALFVPPVFLATLLTRRPLGMLAAGSALSAAIEALHEPGDRKAIRRSRCRRFLR